MKGQLVIQLPPRKRADGKVYDYLLVAPCIADTESGPDNKFETTRLEYDTDVPEEDQDRVFWTIYGYITEDNCEAIADLKSRDNCLDVISQLFGDL